VLPLIGGSGGGGHDYFGTHPGSAGGGAILIAAAGKVAISGSINANGGNADINGGRGSGGAVRILASEVFGSGSVSCVGGIAVGSGQLSRTGDGRIRIETLALARSVLTFPETIAVPPATPPIIWLPGNAPKVRIVSVDGIASPADPTAPLISSADIAIENDGPVNIVLETRNFPIEGDVSVRAAQKRAGAAWIKAQYVSGNQSLATWQITTTFVKGYTTLQARATAP